jgi:hypothetical protein
MRAVQVTHSLAPQLSDYPAGDAADLGALTIDVGRPGIERNRRGRGDLREWA